MNAFTMSPNIFNFDKQWICMRPNILNPASTLTKQKQKNNTIAMIHYAFLCRTLSLTDKVLTRFEIKSEDKQQCRNINVDTE